MSLEQSLNGSNICKDYGASSPTTTELVKESMYLHGTPPSPDQLVTRLKDHHFRFLIGHFPLRKYSAFFEYSNQATIIREPLVRTASEFLHVKRHQGYALSFEQFIERKEMQNRQAKLLAGHPAEMFIGITELYQESIALLNQRFGLKVQVTRRRFGLKLRATRRNVAPKGGAKTFVETLLPDVSARFYQLNKLDLRLYVNSRKKLMANMGKSND